MNMRFERLCLSYLPQLGLKPAKKGQEKKNGVGLTYVPDESVGDGYLWTYPVSPTCSLTIFDLKFYQDVSYQYHHPEVLAIQRGTLESVAPMFHNNLNRPQNLVGYFMEEGIFEQKISKGSYLKSIGISLASEFYEEQHCVPKLKQAVCRLNGSVYVPEVDNLFNQISLYAPHIGTADMRYEAKVIELISSLIEWDSASQLLTKPQNITEKDYETINKLKHFLDKNYSINIDLNELANMCFMSKSKMTHLFRSIYGTSIYDYFLSSKMEHAKELLVNSQKAISKIALTVGYNRQSSFSSAFNKKVGMTPNEFRNSN